MSEQKVRIEEFQVSGDMLLAKIKELVHRFDLDLTFAGSVWRYNGAAWFPTSRGRRWLSCRLTRCRAWSPISSSSKVFLNGRFRAPPLCKCCSTRCCQLRFGSVAC